MAEVKKGRRKGSPQTQQEILDAARTLFAERGFAGTSIRGVAAAAGVDPALVHHYFGTKEGLFRAVLDVPIDPEALVASMTEGRSAEIPRRLVETFLGVWESPETGPAMISFLRRAMADQESATLLRDFVGTTVLRTAAEQLLDHVDSAAARSRIALVVSQMLGLVLLRHVLCVEPLASMPLPRIADAVTPTIERYLHGDSDQLDLSASLTEPNRTPREGRKP